MDTASSPPSSRANAGRIGPLSVLPVFFRMEGRRAVVAGGTQAAAWKAELLAASGARVEVYADNAEPDMRHLVESGKVRLFRSPWDHGVLADAAIAIADAEDDGEARRFLEAGRKAGVPVNCIDRPEYCDFQFGAIVNRSPAVIAISTDGAAPILGQAIRRRIETLLPPHLAQWAEQARRLRAEVMARLALPSARRRFWEAFCEHAFAGPPACGEARVLLDGMKRQGSVTGRVSLVGAGPGDAEHLTLKAVRVLQSADVILFDDHVSPQVLELARREAKRVPVGRQGGRESCGREDVHATMLSLARSGRHVVRLKGGDAWPFGLTGAGAELLNRHGIELEIVPGVTGVVTPRSAPPVQPRLVPAGV